MTAAWFSSFFTGDWLDLQRGSWTDAQSDEQADTIERALELAPGSRVLDLGCGTGRIAIALARRGHAVTAIDLTREFVDDVARAAAANGVAVRVLHRDMRELADLSGFDAAINVWGSFGFFDDTGDRAFVASVFDTLVSGGRFLIENHVLETLLPRLSANTWIRLGDRLALEERRFDVETSRMESSWTFVADGRVSSTHASIRIYSCRELGVLLRDAGFATVRLLDDALAPLAVGARRAIVVATR